MIHYEIFAKNDLWLDCSRFLLRKYEIVLRVNIMELFLIIHSPFRKLFNEVVAEGVSQCNDINLKN